MISFTATGDQILIMLSIAVMIKNTENVIERLFVFKIKKRFLF